VQQGRYDDVTVQERYYNDETYEGDYNNETCEGLHELLQVCEGASFVQGVDCNQNFEEVRDEEQEEDRAGRDESQEGACAGQYEGRKEGCDQV
jgi:hypothetical protein